MRNKRKIERHRKRAKKLAAKNEKRRPDDSFAFGPLRMARFGNVNVFENCATPEEMQEFRKRARANFDQVCLEISADVKICCEIVTKVNSLSLMLRCFWHWFRLSVGAPAEESSQPREREEAFQLLEYMQKLILAVGHTGQSKNISEEDFELLAEATTRFAPFVRCNDKAYCFFARGLTDYLYRAIELGIPKRHSNSDRWARCQKRASEDLTAELFTRMLPRADVYVDAHYWASESSSIKKQWTDCDLLLVYERHLFVVEVKAGRYTHKPPGQKIHDHLQSIKDLIENAAKQANRLVDNLIEHGSLTIYNAKREVQVSLRREDFDEIIRCCVSLDQIDDIASRSEDLSKIGIDIGPHPVWTLSINDLLVLADVFTNPLVFIDYVGERMRAFSCPTCHVADELDHAGLYLQHNRYVMLAERHAPMHTEGWTGYRDEFDRYYDRKWQGVSSDLPTQNMPAWLYQTLECLERSPIPG